jgi:hypothetical protein
MVASDSAVIDRAKDEGPKERLQRLHEAGKRATKDHKKVEWL